VRNFDWCIELYKYSQTWNIRILLVHRQSRLCFSRVSRAAFATVNGPQYTRMVKWSVHYKVKEGSCESLQRAYAFSCWWYEMLCIRNQKTLRWKDEQRVFYIVLFLVLMKRTVVCLGFSHGSDVFLILYI
jgi:hypothetical protein